MESPMTDVEIFDDGQDSVLACTPCTNQEDIIAFLGKRSPRAAAEWIPDEDHSPCKCPTARDRWHYVFKLRPILVHPPGIAPGSRG